MIHSMTGFGKAETMISNRNLSVQLKSLNSKQVDIFLRLPPELKEKELFFRKQLSEKLGRGKIEMTLQIDAINLEGDAQLDEMRFEMYYRQLKNLKEKLGEKEADLFQTISRFPDLHQEAAFTLSKSDWKLVQQAFNKAIQELIRFRAGEGASLKREFQKRIQNILDHLEKALSYEKQRVVTVRERLLNNLQESNQAEKIDPDRFEQELIFYLEKYDISEEKQRLRTHCEYFLTSMEEEGQGKKLGFIAQEIGREINTLGAKANHAEMQKFVIGMKDELEKIKEQVLNVW